jgi:hypothetical protein
MGYSALRLRSKLSRTANSRASGSSSEIKQVYRVERRTAESGDVAPLLFPTASHAALTLFGTAPRATGVMDSIQQHYHSQYPFRSKTPYGHRRYHHAK